MSEAPKPAETKTDKTPLLDVNGEPMHWLVRPTTIKLLWLGGIALLAFVTWLGTTVHPHVKFGIEGTLGFYSWYGFATCVAMVIFAKLLGVGLSKKDTYYDK
ncbi:hypothetical protein [Magnetovibrio sp.]|uniref:hypothetical protein n=1 Tax=Magnetovibrio sp. TaxID=2024836 RepID=UPI002F95BAB1